jgi:predicted ester cyclase
MSTTEENKALVRSWLGGVDTGDPAVIEKYLGGDFDDHNPPPIPGLTPGIQGVRDAFAYALTAFTDFRHEIKAQYADGDMVITRLVGSGKHTGEFLGCPATGKDVEMEGIAIHRIADGKIAEHWAQIDAVGLLIQLGAIPPPPDAA